MLNAGITTFELKLSAQLYELINLNREIEQPLSQKQINMIPSMQTGLVQDDGFEIMLEDGTGVLSQE